MELIQHALSVSNGQETIIAPLGDIQYTGHNEGIAGDALKAHIAKAVKANAWFLGTGDYVDLMSPSNRARMAAAALYDNTEQVIRDKADDLVDSLYRDYLRPTRGQWLGLVHGHHYTDCNKGETTDERLAQHLGTRYLGTCAYVALDFYCGDRHGRVVLWVHHGVGSGKASAPINKLEYIAPYWEADIFVIGHMTKLAGAPINRVYLSFAGGVGHLEHKKILLVGAGGWSKAYMSGNKRNGRPTGCYVEQGMMPPTALGGSLIRIKACWDNRRWCPELSVEV